MRCPLGTYRPPKYLPTAQLRLDTLQAFELLNPGVADVAHGRIGDSMAMAFKRSPSDSKMGKGEPRCSTHFVGPGCQRSRCRQGLLPIQAMGMMGDIHGLVVFANHILTILIAGDPMVKLRSGGWFPACGGRCYHPDPRWGSASWANLGWPHRCSVLTDQSRHRK